MVKDTSLLSALPLSTERFFQLRAIGSRTFAVFPVAVAATLWYLVLGSVFMAIQYSLEQRFGQRFGAGKTPGAKPVVATGLGGR